MDLSDLLPGIAATLASTGIIALVAFMMPSVRWTRQLARDVGILTGLPVGDERDAWEERVIAHAQRLRLFRDEMPSYQKVYPWVPVFLLIGSIGLAILDPRQIDGLIAEGPVIFFIGLAAFLGTVRVFVTGVQGLTTTGKSAEDLVRLRGTLANEAS